MFPQAGISAGSIPVHPETGSLAIETGFPG